MQEFNQINTLTHIINTGPYYQRKNTYQNFFKKRELLILKESLVNGKPHFLKQSSDLNEIKMMIQLGRMNKKHYEIKDQKKGKMFVNELWSKSYH
jgi:hypothetical protein